MLLRGRLHGRPSPVRELRRRVAALGPDVSVAGQSLVALAVNSSTSLVAGAALGSITDTFQRVPGLLILVPAAIGLRGNVFAALGSRLSTAIHTGTFRLSGRRGTVVGDNLLAALLLTAGVSLGLAVLADLIAALLGQPQGVSLVDLTTISVLGGLLASALVLVLTVVLAVGAARRGWDLDNLVAPVVSTVGDVLTIPALWIVAGLVGHGPGSAVLSWAAAALAAAGTVYGLRTRWPLLRSLVRQSWPVLMTAGLLSTLAGVTIEGRLDTFSTYPALLVLVPAFVSSAGAIGGILASRVATGLHLGTLRPVATPGRAVRRDAAMLALSALPLYLFNAAGAHAVARSLGQASPGLGPMVAAGLLGGAGAVAFAMIVAYYGSVAAYRMGVDPDTYGIPVVTSSVDFVGAVALVVAFVAVGVGVT